MEWDPAPATSWTDRSDYRSFCLRAATDPEVFATFRVAEEFEHIVYVSPDTGTACRLCTKGLRSEDFARLAVSDSIGSPRDTDEWGISPVTWRYALRAQQLERHFGSLVALHVVEIGAGYGGLAGIMLRAELPPDIWTIIDLPEPSLLQARYLTALGVSSRVDWTPSLGLFAADLLVSDYAFSELKPWVQAEYLATVVPSCRRGWMTCNFVNDGMSPDELLEIVRVFHPSAEWRPEEPATHEANRTLVWGAHG